MLPASLVKRADLLFRDIQIGTSSVLNGNIDTVRSHYVQCVCVCVLVAVEESRALCRPEKGKCHLPFGVAALRLSFH